jgi:hypothetical protein
MQNQGSEKKMPVWQYFWTSEAEECKSSFIVFEIIHHFSYRFKLFQMQMVVSPNTVPVQLDQELNSSKSHIGLRKIMYYLKCDKIGLTPFGFSGPDFAMLVIEV